MISESAIVGVANNVVRIIAGVISPRLSKKYFDQPKIYLSVSEGTPSKRNLGISVNNEIKKEIIDGREQEYYDGNNALRFFEIGWKYKLTLHNNSEHPAYHLRLIVPSSQNECTITPEINYLKPLQQNTSDSFVISFTSIIEATGAQSVEILNNGSEHFKKSKVILEYTNVKGRKFYTLFDYNKAEEERNSFHRKMPKL